MKKYLPFASLVEQKEYLSKMLYEKNKKDKPQISIEQAEKINRILKNYLPGQTYHITIYVDGYVKEYDEQILDINLTKRLITFKDFIAPINSLIDILEINPFEEIC